MEVELVLVFMVGCIGKVIEVIGMFMCVSGFDVWLGELCEVIDEDGIVL